MHPHLTQALDIVNQRTRNRQAQLDLARRTYFRALLLPDPPASPTALADAVQLLQISPADFHRDAEVASLARQLESDLARLNEQSSAASAAAKAEDPTWEPIFHPDDLPSPGPAVLAAHRTLTENQQLTDSIQTQLLHCRQRAPHLFSPDTQTLLHSPDPAAPPSPGTPEPHAPPLPLKFNLPKPTPNYDDPWNTPPSPDTPTAPRHIFIYNGHSGIVSKPKPPSPSPDPWS